MLSWQERNADGQTVLRSVRFDNSSWVEPQTIAQGNDWFVNWADFSSVVPIDSSVAIAHWLPLKADRRYAYDIQYSLSADGGRSWSQARILNADAAVAEHGFVSFFPWGNDIGAIWLDGRVLAALTVDELFDLEEAVGMTLRYARLDRSGNVMERGQIDDLVCDCCQTDAVSTATGALIVYRDRTQEEIRDISVRRSVPAEDGAGASAQARWSEAVTLGPDGWKIDGCPVNGPALSAAGRHVGVAWFTAADNEPRLRFTRSRDSGASFEPAVTISADGVLGQTDITMTDDGLAWVSAWHRADNGMELRVHRISEDSRDIDTRVAATTSESLPSDVPQLALAGGRLVLAWSEIGNPGRLYSAMLPVW